VSIILSWENPKETFLPLIHRAEVWRTAPNSNLRYFKIAHDAAWGTFEDTEGVDPKCGYRIDYMNNRDVHRTSIQDQDIRRMVRQPDMARIIFSFRSPDGFKAAAKNIEISNELNGADFYRSLLTNHNGHAEFFATYGQRLQMKIEGWTNILDCVIPAKRDVCLEDLRANGTLLPLDQRGLS
jgi:hypothetical protein